MFADITQIIISMIIFCAILFIYLHVQFHLKTGNDLEIYEIDQASKERMEEICDLRQPVLLDCDDEGNKIIESTNKRSLIDNYPVFEIKIRETATENNASGDLCVPLPLNVAARLFAQDKHATYFSESNLEFLTETGAVKHMAYNDKFLRPTLVSNCYYDVMFGSNNLKTPFRYELNYRNYFLVTQGSITVKLAPPKNAKYLYPNSDYETFEFSSPVDPWEPQSRFKADFDKIKCLEITLTPGKFLFIPAYWWYSFKFGDDTSVSCFKYRTYMNNIAISPNIFMYALQNQNIERKFAKQFDAKSHSWDDEHTDIHVSNDDTTPISNDNIEQVADIQESDISQTNEPKIL